MNQFKEMRERVKLTQAQVAEALGHVSPQFISNIERGVACYPPKTLKTVAKLFKVDLNTLSSICYEIAVKRSEARLKKLFKK